MKLCGLFSVTILELILFAAPTLPTSKVLIALTSSPLNSVLGTIILAEYFVEEI